MRAGHTSKNITLESLPDSLLALVVDHLSGRTDKKALRAVSRRLRAFVDSKVSELRIGRYDITPNDLDNVAARWPALRVLHLGKGLPSAAAPGLARATFASLEELDLKFWKQANYQIPSDAVIALAEAVARMPRLRVLNLTGIQIGDAGVQALAQLKCPSLEDLSLGKKNPGAFWIFCNC